MKELLPNGSVDVSKLHNKTKQQFENSILEIKHLISTVTIKEDVYCFNVVEKFEADDLSCVDVIINDVSLQLYYYESLEFLNNWFCNEESFNLLLKSFEISLYVEEGLNDSVS